METQVLEDGSALSIAERICRVFTRWFLGCGMFFWLRMGCRVPATHAAGDRGQRPLGCTMWAAWKGWLMFGNVTDAAWIWDAVSRIFFLCHQGGDVDHANVTDHLLAPAGVGFGPSVFWYSHVELAEPQWGHGLETDVAGNDLQQSAVAASGLFLQKILAVEQFPLSLWAISTLDCGIVSVIPVGTLYGLLILTFYVTSFLACTLTFYPTFDLGSILTNFLAYSVTLFLAL